MGGLEYDVEKADLLGLFQDCGHVEEVRFPGQQEVGGKAVKGIAFVVFDSAMAARRACGLSGEMFKGRKLKVAPAGERPKGKGKEKGGGKGSEDHGSRQYVRDMLDGKWERGMRVPSPRRSRSPRRSPARRSKSRSRPEKRRKKRRSAGLFMSFLCFWFLFAFSCAELLRIADSKAWQCYGAEVRAARAPRS